MVSTFGLKHCGRDGLKTWEAFRSRRRMRGGNPVPELRYLRRVINGVRGFKANFLR